MSAPALALAAAEPGLMHWAAGLLELIEAEPRPEGVGLMVTIELPDAVTFRFARHRPEAAR